MKKPSNDNKHTMSRVESSQNIQITSPIISNCRFIDKYVVKDSVFYFQSGSADSTGRRATQLHYYSCLSYDVDNPIHNLILQTAFESPSHSYLIFWLQFKDNWCGCCWLCQFFLCDRGISSPVIYSCAQWYSMNIMQPNRI